MRALDLIQAAKHLWINGAINVQSMEKYRVFEYGATWMYAWIQHLKPEQSLVCLSFYRATLFGVFKYGLSLICFGIAVVFLGRISIWLTPLAILIFYAVESLFLFLFPILIENQTSPLRASIQLTWRIGWANAIKTVMLIGFFMLFGLLNYKNPLKNWYIGCLAVLIWYCQVEHLTPPNPNTSKPF